MSKFFQHLDYWWFTDGKKPYETELFDFYSETDELSDGSFNADSSDSSDEFYSLSSFYHQLRAMESDERKKATSKTDAKTATNLTLDASLELPVLTRANAKGEAKTKKEKVDDHSALKDAVLKDMVRLSKLNTMDTRIRYRQNSGNDRDQLESVNWPKEGKSWIEMLYVDEDENSSSLGASLA